VQGNVATITQQPKDITACVNDTITFTVAATSKDKLLYQWFKNNTYYLDESHDPHDREMAFKRSIETEKYPLGIFYLNSGNKTFEEGLKVYSTNQSPLYKREFDVVELKKLIDSKK
jgi:hypothetical protein